MNIRNRDIWAMVRWAISNGLVEHVEGEPLPPVVCHKGKPDTGKVDIDWIGVDTKQQAEHGT